MVMYLPDLRRLSDSPGIVGARDGWNHSRTVSCGIRALVTLKVCQHIYIGICRSGLTEEEGLGLKPGSLVLLTSKMLLVACGSRVGFINHRVVLPLLLQEDIRKLVVQLLQTGGVWFIRYISKPRDSGVEVTKEDRKVGAEEGVHLFCSPG